MSLQNEIEVARKEIVSDGYDMSVGELINLYKENEIKINPEFQRLFRWDETRKTRFVESILLGLPLPPIFVYQSKNGIWERIDGLQRLSTIFEFVGILVKADGTTSAPGVLEGTRFLPDLVNRKWLATDDSIDDGLGTTLQLQFKRARMRVEILKQESDPQAKFELFQRLNTGGQNLSEQEVRNCVGIMLDGGFQNWLASCADNANFRNTISQTESAIERQMHVELALRFFAFRHIPYTNGLDVHEYLDDALVRLVNSQSFNRIDENSIFEQTFQLLSCSMGDTSFKRWNGTDFTGKFLMSVYEIVALGISKNISAILALGSPNSESYIRQRCVDLWSDSTFTQHSGAGVRGTTRLAKLLPMAEGFFQP
jgi:hypothetical protein